MKTSAINRAKLRELRRQNRKRRDAQRMGGSRTTATMKEHLISAGLNYKIAERFSATVSRYAGTHIGEVIVLKKVKRSRKKREFSTYTYTPNQAFNAVSKYLANGGPRKDLNALAALNEMMGY